MHPSTRPFVPAAAAWAVVQPGKFSGGTVRLPGSKSMTNRALLMAALASGKSQLRNALDCDDSRYLVNALRKLGVEIIAADDFALIDVNGCGGSFPVKSGEFFLGNAGTATRFLTAALTTAGGVYRVDGDERMRQRPIGDLVRALNQLGAEVRAPAGSPPVDIGPHTLLGGEINLPASISSQFASGVLMAAPYARRTVSLRLEGELVSRPYLDLTVAGMRDFGAKVYVDDKRPDGQPVFEVIAGRGYRGRAYFVEGDASAASYFYAAAAITGATVRVEGVGKETRQGDLRCADVLAEMGARVKKDADAVTVSGGLLRGVDCDCSDMPDVVPTLAVAGLFARGRTRLRGVAHLRHKESDRIAALASELGKLGATVRQLKDGLEVEGTLGPDPSLLRGAEIDTWGDHRIAMALATAGLVLLGLRLANPQVVGKSYPGFFQALASLGAGVSFLGADGERIEPPAAGGRG
jgi:3-phosphoshikimate 1-carboxyvinyltransferase